MNVSVVIIAKNEEDVIAKCISSVGFAQEVIVVDANSTDATAGIAESLGAKVISHAWQGYGQQKNFGASKAMNDWILFVDADEEVSKELASILSTMPESPEYNVYWITIEDIFLGKRMKYLIGHNPRLMKKGAASWSNKKVHEQLYYIADNEAIKYRDGKSGEITAPIIHTTYKTVAEYLQKMHVYTTLDAEDMHERGSHRSGTPVHKTIFLPYRLAVKQGIKLLLYRKGILDGWQGITWCVLSAYYEFEMGKKFIAL